MADNDDVFISKEDQPAADLIRDKVKRLYANEPNADIELGEAEQTEQLSKHQRFIYKLSKSGNDLATIQTKWHDYYASLNEDEKQTVWQEFYDSQNLVKDRLNKVNSYSSELLSNHKSAIIRPPRTKPLATKKTKLVSDKVKERLSSNGKLQAKHHLQSLFFGVGMGLLVVFIFLFGFFNEVIIAPFIQPSRASASTPIIISSSGIAPTPMPEVIIPKINVQIPVDYSLNTTDENVIENDLEAGVVHYPTTVLPGQSGNAAFFGHSSNNIFNPGKYKFAFVLLRTLVNGDTFYLTYNDKVYVYQVLSHTIVDPSDISVLGNVPGQSATATLITCDPPGTSIHRLVVIGRQISPDPSSNSAATISPLPISKTLPNDGKTLLARLLDTSGGKVIATSIILAVVVYGFRKLNSLYS